MVCGVRWTVLAGVAVVLVGTLALSLCYVPRKAVPEESPAVEPETPPAVVERRRPRSAPPMKPWGTISGIVVHAGPCLPTRQEIQLSEMLQHCLKGGKLLTETWVVNPSNRGIQNAVIWLELGQNEGTSPSHPSWERAVEKPVVIDQPHGAFVPHVAALQQGQLLRVRNNSPISHSVRWAGGSRNPGDSVLLPPGGERQIGDLKASSVPVVLRCNLHGWMNAYLRVFDHPYFTVTDADGFWEMQNIPPGNHRVFAWHEAGGSVYAPKPGQSVTVVSGGVAELTFTFPAEG